jgi:LuxR family maltose regulon positive regulatory protein
MNLGIAELWSFKMDDAERHLEQSLSLARQIGRPYIEVGCLAHLALVAGQRSLTEQRRRSSEAIAVAEAHGFGADVVVAVALTTMGMSDAIQGRFTQARTWLDRAETVLPAELEPATALLMSFARGLQYAGAGDHERALDAFRKAEEMQTRLVTRHVVTIQARELITQTQLRLGDIASARGTVSRFSDDDRNWGEGRAALAAVHLADGKPREAIKLLAPVLERKAPFIREFTLIEGLLFDAIARDQLGDPAAADAGIERALDVAERDALIAPFVVAPADELLARHAHRASAHPGLLTDILDVLRGSAPADHAAAGEGVAADLSESELRVLRYLPSHLSAHEIATELFVSVTTVKTHMRHVYEKLGVHRRTEAVERARALGLLGASVRSHR